MISSQQVRRRLLAEYQRYAYTVGPLQRINRPCLAARKILVTDFQITFDLDLLAHCRLRFDSGGRALLSTCAGIRDTLSKSFRRWEK
jgi:hypothetical protein